ncbi:MAG: domain/HD domain protein [Myxococcales bacterium]|nr:domain/HD domain protein [Myxococcales bacterium]
MVHTSPTAVAEIRDVLQSHVTTDSAHTEADAIRRLGDSEYSVVIIDFKPPIDAKRIVSETIAAQPDAFIVLMTPDLDSGRELDVSLSGKVFRFLAGPDQRWQLTGIVAEGLRLQKLERDQKELIKKLSLEYGKLQRREKLLDVVVKERTKELQVAYDRLKAASRQALLGLAEAIEAKDPYTKGHCGRTAVFATALGREARLSESDMEVLEFGAFLHDIGKIGIRDSVLLKPGALDDEEWKHMKVHPVVGYQIAAQLDMLKPMMACIRNHHERWDGSGYPDKLKGEDIPLLARIVCLGDAYDAMATDRPYKKAIPMDECKKILRRQAGPQFDPDLVELFIKAEIMEAFA